MDDNGCAANKSDMLHYYEIRMSAYSSYLNISWNRFNWMLTLELALYGVYFGSASGFSDSLQYDEIMPIVGFIISALWVVVGGQDHKTIEELLNKKRYVNHRIIELLDIEFVKRNSRKKIFKQSYILFIFPLISFIGWLMIYFINRYV